MPAKDPDPARDHGHDHGHDDDRPERLADAPGNGPGHTHGHAHAHGRIRDERRLLATLLLGVLYMGVEAVGGWYIGSLALLADAGHMLSDAAALALTLFALRIARLPADPRRTYGYHRAEVLAAVANAAALLYIGVWVLVEAWQRWGTATAISGPAMLLIATGGLLVNGIGLAILHGADRSGLNVRAAWLHLLSDALGSAGAITAGLLIWWKGWAWADPVASAFISVLVLRSAWGLLSDAVGVLMEGVPAHIDIARLRRALEGVPGVTAVHDVHVWTITSGIVAMSGHVVAAEGQSHAEVLNRVAGVLRGEFGIWHSTIQVEPRDFQEAEMHR